MIICGKYIVILKKMLVCIFIWLSRVQKRSIAFKYHPKLLGKPKAKFFFGENERARRKQVKEKKRRTKMMTIFDILFFLLVVVVVTVAHITYRCSQIWTTKNSSFTRKKFNFDLYSFSKNSPSFFVCPRKKWKEKIENNTIKENKSQWAFHFCLVSSFLLHYHILYSFFFSSIILHVQFSLNFKYITCSWYIYFLLCLGLLACCCPEEREREATEK